MKSLAESGVVQLDKAERSRALNKIMAPLRTDQKFSDFMRGLTAGQP